MQDEDDNTKIDGLIDQVDEHVSTDKALDLKSGIYNLFVSIFYVAFFMIFVVCGCQMTFEIQFLIVLVQL